MSVATKLLRKKPASVGSQYGVSFPGLGANYLSSVLSTISYDADWIIDMDLTIDPSTGSVVRGLFSSPDYYQYLSGGRLVLVGANVGYPTPSALPLGIKFNLIMERSGTEYKIYVNGSLFYTLTIPASARFLFKDVGRYPDDDGLSFQGVMHDLKIGTILDPSQHYYVNNTGAGTAWQDIGTVGGADLNFVGTVSWVSNS